MNTTDGVATARGLANIKWVDTVLGAALSIGQTTVLLFFASWKGGAMWIHGDPHPGNIILRS